MTFTGPELNQNQSNLHEQVCFSLLTCMWKSVKSSSGPEEGPSIDFHLILIVLNTLLQNVRKPK
jgi:hypothetical protein